MHFWIKGKTATATTKYQNQITNCKNRNKTKTKTTIAKLQSIRALWKNTSDPPINMYGFIFDHIEFYLSIRVDYEINFWGIEISVTQKLE